MDDDTTIPRSTALNRDRFRSSESIADEQAPTWKELAGSVVLGGVLFLVYWLVYLR